MKTKKNIKVAFFGVPLVKDSLLGYHWTRFAKGADVILYETGSGAWLAKMYFGPTGSGQVILQERGRTPERALKKLEGKVEELVRDFAAAAAKHARTLVRVLDTMAGAKSPRPRAKSKKR